MNSSIIIRSICPEDAAAFVNLQKKLAAETNFLLQTQSEVDLVSVETQRLIIQRMYSKEISNHVLVAEMNGQLIGFIGYATNNFHRMKHVVSRLAIGVIEDFYRIGCATMLFKRAEDIWREQSIIRIEFTTMVDNFSAINLYLKLGCQIEGIRKNAINRNDNLIDEYYFSKKIC